MRQRILSFRAESRNGITGPCQLLVTTDDGESALHRALKLAIVGEFGVSLRMIGVMVVFFE